MEQTYLEFSPITWQKSEMLKDIKNKNSVVVTSMIVCERAGSDQKFLVDIYVVADKGFDR